MIKKLQIIYVLSFAIFFCDCESRPVDSGSLIVNANTGGTVDRRGTISKIRLATPIESKTGGVAGNSIGEFHLPDIIIVSGDGRENRVSEEARQLLETYYKKKFANCVAFEKSTSAETGHELDREVMAIAARTTSSLKTIKTNSDQDSPNFSEYEAGQLVGFISEIAGSSCNSTTSGG